MTSRSRGGFWRGRGGRWSRGGGSSSGSSSQPPAVSSQLQKPPPECPYWAWPFYFPTESFTKGSPTVLLVQTFENFFSTACIDVDAVDTNGCLTVDFSELSKHSGAAEFVDRFHSTPEHHLSCLHLALHQTIRERHRLDDNAEPGPETCSWSPESPEPLCFVRLFNVQPAVPLRALKANLYGKFIAVRGTVVRVSPVQPRVTHLAFRCINCQDRQVVLLQAGRYAPPPKCASGPCRSKNFEPLRSDPATRTIDRQVIRIQVSLSVGRGSIKRCFLGVCMQYFIVIEGIGRATGVGIGG